MRAALREEPANEPRAPCLICRVMVSGTLGNLLKLYVLADLARRVAVAETGSSGQGCLGYRPRISARTAA